MPKILRTHLHSLFVPAFLFVTLFASSASAQLKIIEDAENNLTIYQLTVSPAAQPKPAFKYRLLIHEDDRHDGNAAPFYYRSMLYAVKNEKEVHEKYGENYDNWQHVDRFPLDKLPLETIRKVPDIYSMDELREATSRKFCDWGWKIEDRRGPEIYAFLLTEIQKGRGVSRMLSLKTRVALAEGKQKEALELLQMNYQLGRDIGKPRFLVCSLVGIAICRIGNEQTLELIAQPNSPNLYWAFAELPKPMIDLRPAMRFELRTAFRAFPLIKNPEKEDHSPEEWSRLIGKAWLSLREYVDYSGRSSPSFGEDLFGKEAWHRTQPQLVATGFGLVGYTQAKRSLVAHGMPFEKVEAMPVGQVIAVQAARAFEHTSNEFEKLTYMSYPEMRRYKDKIMKDLERDGYLSGGIHSKEMIPIASLLLPATHAARVAEERLTRDFAAMQVIEALRMHAAEIGEFPTTLAEITLVPVPKNPATEQPFVYSTKTSKGKRTAILDLPKTDGFFIARRFELTLRPQVNRP